MIDIKVDTGDLSKLAQRLSNIRNNLPKDLARSMTYAAYDAQKKLRAETPRFVDRPTAWTQRSTFVERATPTSLTIRMGFKDEAPKGTPAARYLQPMVAGEPRPMKRFESQLYRSGVLRAGEYAIPTGIRPLAYNAYGNLTGGQYTRVISRIGGFGQQGYTANASASSRSRAKRRQQDFFIGEPGGRRRAIYARVGPQQRGFVPVFTITRSQPQYTGRFPVRTIIQDEFSNRFPSIFERLVFTGR